MYEEPHGNLDYEGAVRLAEEADAATAAPQPPPVDASEAPILHFTSRKSVTDNGFKHPLWTQPIP